MAQFPLGDAMKNISGGLKSLRALLTVGSAEVSDVNPVPIKLAMEIYGATVANRPAASAVQVGAIFMAVQTQEIWQSDGTSWVVI